MIFSDINKFENMSIDELKKCITKPKRVKSYKKLLRSSMMLNPLKLKHLNRLDNLNTDIVIVNLEDGVAKEMKERALVLASLFISNLKNSNSKIVVRVNPVYEGGREEIAFLNAVKPDAIRVAKIRQRSDVESVLKLLDSDINLHLSIETKESLENLTTLNVDGKVQCCSLGIMDMLNSLGLPQSLLKFGNPAIEYIMSRFLIDARIAGIYPIGFTYQDYLDLEGYKKWCLLEKSMGYGAKSCLGPKQVEIANEIFKDDESEKLRAGYIKELFEKMEKQGITGFMDEKYGFIDEPIYKDALLILK